MLFLRYTSPECVFVRIPKTGSTSIVRGMLGGADAAAEKTYGYFPESWRRYYSFAFVRNPFDRLVSCFNMFQTFDVHNKAEENFRSVLTLDSVMNIIEDGSVPLDYVVSGESYFSHLKRHAIPMTHSFFCLHHVKEIFRFENFNSDYVAVGRKLGLTITDVAHHRKSGRAGYRHLFTSTLRERAERIFNEDIRTFGYSF